MITSGLVCSFLLSLSICAFAQLPELHEADLSGWDCLSKLEGAAKTPDSSERNRQKNRSAVDLRARNVQLLDFETFLSRVTGYDQQIGKSHRRYLDSEGKAKHLELSETPADHPAQVGDPTPIICEGRPGLKRRFTVMAFESGN
jgi:hypothetical protein